MSVSPEETPAPSGPSVHPILKQLSIVQHNSLGSWDVFLSLFNSFRGLPQSPQVVFLQDPPFYRNRLPMFSGFKSFAPPPPQGKAVKVAAYISLDFLNSYSILPVFFGRLDLMAIDVFTPAALFCAANRQFRLYNLYSTSSPGPTRRTIVPTDAFRAHSFPTLVVGDFNIHHTLADPLRHTSSNEFALSAPYFDRALDLGFTLVNTLGVHTRFPFNLSTRPSVLDLSFSNTPLAPFVSSWDVSLPSTGSDHLPIRIILSAPHLRPAPPSPDWTKTDWSALVPLLKSFDIPPPPSFPNDVTVDAWLDKHLTSLTTLLKAHTPLKRPTSRSKPWWSKELTHLRQNFHRTTRAHRRDPSPSSLSEARTTKRVYFKAIK